MWVLSLLLECIWVIYVGRSRAMKYLLLAEKPSLCKEIQACYTRHYSEISKKVGEIDFISLAGHICGHFQVSDYAAWQSSKWEDIEYPMIPTVWKVKASNDARDLQIIREIKAKLASKEYDGLINACDSDQEGYGIFFLLMEYLNAHDIKTLRFMEHSLTDAEILKSLLTMTDLHTDPTHIQFVDAFKLRSRADWLYGMNLTCLMSVKLESLLTVGRVKAPTIKLVYDNSLAIESFKPRKYYELVANYGDFTATYVGDERNPIQFDNLINIPAPPLIGTVRERQVDHTTTGAPKLYDLTSIQADAGSQYGIKPTETLAILQSLYEKHKVISYPRTQCQYISSEKAKEFPDMLEKIGAFPELVPFVAMVTKADIERAMQDKRIVNDVEVQKESHNALLPTDKQPNLLEMTEKEQIICQMVYRRLLAQFLPPQQVAKTVLTIAHGDHIFQAKGKVITEQGWRILYSEGKDEIIPDLKEGETIATNTMGHIAKTTRAPKRLTQSDLVAAMKNIASQVEDPELKKSLADSQGIGTPATRAAIIHDILKRGYVYEQGDALYISDIGKTYIKSLEGLDIISPIFAAKLDTEIKKIQRGEASYEEIYENVLDNLKATCQQVEAKSFSAEATDYKCPNCQTAIQDKKYSYVCPSCDYQIPKQLLDKAIDEKILKILFAGKTTPIYNFTSKEGKPFKARLLLTNEGIKFDYSTGIPCPLCGSDNVRITTAGAFCDCGLKVFRKMAGHKFTDTELKTLLKHRKVRGINNFIGKSGKSFSANVVLNNEGKTEFQFESKPKTVTLK